MPLFTLLFVESYKGVSFSLLFAPLGTLIRFRASFFNFKYPIGTLTANILGCVILAIMLIVQSISIRDNNLWIQYFIVGIIQGFCGCLTTISTFIKELVDLPFNYSWKYFSISIILAQISFLIIAGSYHWTVGLV